MSAIFEGKNDDTISEIIPEGLKSGGNLKSSVITNKSSLKVYPIGNQQVHSDNSKQILFRIASSDYLIPNTAALNFKCKVPNAGIHLQDMCVSLLESITLQVGGVEVEYLTHISDLVKTLVYHSVGKNEYENVMGPQLGSWKYTPRYGSFVGHDANRFLKVDNAARAQTAVTDANSASGTGYDVNRPVEGALVRIDSFAIADDEDGLFTGREFSIPVSLLLGFFRIKNMIPTWAVGSIDIKIDFAKFDAACLIATQYDRNANGLLTVTRADNNNVQAAPGDSAQRVYEVPQAHKYYELSDINMTIDTVSCDPSYNTLLASLISTSSVVLPFETYATIARTFQNSGSNQLLVSRGVSYLKQSHMVMKPLKMVDNPYVMEQHVGADIWKSHQIEIGSKLFHPARINTLIGAWREKEIAFNQYNRQGSATCIDYETFCNKKSKFTTMPNMPVPTINPNSRVQTAQPNLFPKCQFVISMNYEKLLGGNGNLSGLNSRLSGYNLHLDLELQSTGFTEEDNVNYPWYNDSNGMMLLTFLHHDRSLILSRDTVQVSE